MHDQRHIFGRDFAGPDEFDAYARNVLATRRRPPIKVTDDDRTLTAYVNRGRWVADCPYCGGGLGCWPENPHSICLTCGHRYAIEFPPANEIARVEADFATRDMANQNWNIHQGESADATILDRRA